VVVAYFKYYFQRAREEFNLARIKGEALLVKWKEMGDYIKKINMNIKRAIYSGNGEGLPHERFLELYGPEGTKSVDAFSAYYDVQTLVDVYFPACRPQLYNLGIDINQYFDRLNSILLMIPHGVRTDEAASELIDTSEINRLCANLMSHIQELDKGVTREIDKVRPKGGAVIKITH
jgi:hypothetical protein